MPIPRRISPPAYAIETSSQASGVFRAGERPVGGPVSDLTELDDAFADLPAVPGKNLDELEEVFDDDFPDVPSLMPGPTTPGPDLAEVFVPKAAPPPEVPALDLAPPRFAQAQRTRSLEAMQAVRAPEPAAPPATGSVFDPSFDEELVDIPLDLKAPPKNQAAATSLAGGELAPPPAAPAARAVISSTKSSGDPMPGIVAFAGYGLPPEKLGGTPAYALRVLVRKMQLKDDLRIARMRRIADVSLYEAALACADESAVTKGIALIAIGAVGSISAIVAAATFLL